MKRGWTILLAGALSLAIALPVGAAKPDCELDDSHPSCKTDDSTTTTTTEPADKVVCQFDDNGKLLGYSGTESEPYKCEWTITGPAADTYRFELRAADGSSSVLRPHLFVTDAYPIGDKCFDQMDNGWQPLPYTFGPFTPPPEGVSCDSPTYNITDADTDDPDNVYSLVIAARAKGATLELWLVES